MRKISLIVLLTYLFSGSVYPINSYSYNNLRVPVNDIEKAGRLKEAETAILKGLHDAAMAVAFVRLSEDVHSEFSQYGGGAALAGLDNIIKTSRDDTAKAIAYSRLVNSTRSEFNPYGGIISVDALHSIANSSTSDTAKAIAHKRLADYYSYGHNTGAYMNAINALELIAEKSADPVAKAIACCHLISYYSIGTNHEALRRYIKIRTDLYLNGNSTAKAIIAASLDYQAELRKILYEDTTAGVFAKAIAAEYLSRRGSFVPLIRSAAVIFL